MSLASFLLLALVGLALNVSPALAQFTTRCECYCAGISVGTIAGYCNDFNCWSAYRNFSRCSSIYFVNARFINPIGTLIGVAVGGIIFIVVIIVVSIWYCRYRKRAREENTVYAMDGAVYNNGAAAPVVYTAPTATYGASQYGAGSTYVANQPTYAAQSYPPPQGTYATPTGAPPQGGYAPPSGPPPGQYAAPAYAPPSDQKVTYA
ncbi:hypothetical protein BC829DRAFT_408246 [Chytridium lagenaria]|nr:hypothetical protein BC829DRAFT_408246 [Chytridium lagenaria]